MASIEQHLSKLQIIFGRGKDSAAAGEEGAVHEIRIVLFHKSLVRCLGIQRCDPWIVGFGGIEKSVLHPERPEDSLCCKLIELHARGSFHDQYQGVETRLSAIGPSRSRLKLQRDLSETWNVIRV